MASLEVRPLREDMGVRAVSWTESGLQMEPTAQVGVTDCSNTLTNKNALRPPFTNRCNTHATLHRDPHAKRPKYRAAPRPAATPVAQQAVSKYPPVGASQSSISPAMNNPGRFRAIN